jgi:protein-arginine kinase activator protein McsA
MAHKRKDTLCRTKVNGWNKHMKPWGKRVQNKAERKAAANFIREMKEDFIQRQDFETAAACRDVEQALDQMK